MSDKNNTVRLTVENIRAMKQGDELLCHVVPGLHARRGANHVSWCVSYRDARGDRRRPTIGRYPALGLEPARAAAKLLLQAVARGEDPSSQRRAERAAPRVRDMIARYKADEMPTLKPRSRLVYAHALDVFAGAIGAMRAADVTSADVRRALELFGGPYAANNGRRVFRRMWNVARASWRLDLPANPVEGTKANPHRARRRKAGGDEMRRVIEALETLRVEFPAHVACIMCLVYTGARASEMTTATRNELSQDADGARLTKRDHKTARMGEDRVIAVPRQALDEIARLPRLASGRIFGPEYLAIYRVWTKARATAGCPDLRLHDLRRTWASHGKSAGMSLHATGELLGHRATQTTAGYAYLFNDAATAGAQAIADSVEATKESKN